MNLLQVVVMALVEGITEFLPISSTGHLILTAKLLNIAQTDFVKSFEIIIQLGAILAIVVLYFKKFVKDYQTWIRLVVAFIPTGIIGLTVYGALKRYLLGNLIIDVIALFIGGIFMIVLEKYFASKQSSTIPIAKLSLGRSLLIGLTQSIALIPGVSRAGATIYGALFVGLNRKSATEFSFLLAVPTMLAASLFDTLKSKDIILQSQNLAPLCLGFILSFVSALITVKWLVGYVQKHNFIVFGVYRMVLAIVFLIFAIL